MSRLIQMTLREVEWKFTTKMKSIPKWNFGYNRNCQIMDSIADHFPEFTCLASEIHGYFHNGWCHSGSKVRLQQSQESQT